MKNLLLRTLIGSLALCSLSAFAQERVIRFGNDGAYPPFSETAANGEMTGFDIDMAKAICAELKAKCELKQIDWDALIPALNTKKIDGIIASMNATAERSKSVLFTDAYYQNPARFVRKKGSKVEISKEGLQGKTMGVLRGSIADIYASVKYNRLINLKVYGAQTDAFLDMRAGRLDVLFADGFVLEEGFLKRPEGKDFEAFGSAISDPEYFGNGLAIAVRKNDQLLATQINGAIKALRASGEYQKISHKYFGRDIYNK